MAIVNQHPAFSNAAQAMREIPVNDSSFLQMFRYDQASFQLTVVFKNGAEYIHQSIFPMTVDQLLESPNMSKFYLSNIRGKTQSSKIIDKNVGPRGGFNHGTKHSGNTRGRNSGTKGAQKSVGRNPRS